MRAPVIAIAAVAAILGAIAALALGNVTGLTDELERDGLVTREPSPDDRRAWIVRLTTKGRRAFEAMAHEHEQWILEMFAGLDARTVQQLYTHLGALRVQLVRHDQPAEEKA